MKNKKARVAVDGNVSPPPSWHGSHGRVATSDLSVTEFLTLARIGFVPRGLVVGVSVYDAGVVWAPSTVTIERNEIGAAMRAARRLAVKRLRDQAANAGAEGVVGVRIEAEHHPWRGGHMVARFVAVGTAIALDRTLAPPELAGAPSLALRSGPFTSGLAGQDFTMLLAAGYRPVTLALGTCVYQVSTTALVGAWALGNVELPEHTHAFMDARERAMADLLEDLQVERSSPTVEDRPVGVVGMRVDERPHAGRDDLVEFTAIGTAVAPLHEDDPRRTSTLPEPRLVVPLDR